MTDSCANPSSDPAFGKTVDKPVWYLSHPIAPDSHMTMEQNIDDTKEWVEFFWRHNIRVIAPYLLIIELLNDEEQFRVPGLEADVALCRKMGRIFLTGHKFSSGMRHEYEGTMEVQDGISYNFIGWTKQQVESFIATMPEGLL